MFYKELINSVGDVGFIFFPIDVSKHIIHSSPCTKDSLTYPYVHPVLYYNLVALHFSRLRKNNIIIRGLNSCEF